MLSVGVIVDVQSQEAGPAASRGSSSDDRVCRLRCQGDVAVSQCAAVDEPQTADTESSAQTAT